MIGIQQKGASNQHIYDMALRALKHIGKRSKPAVVADIGAGEGFFTKILSARFQQVFMVDAFQPDHIPGNVQYRKADLNRHLPLEDASVDALFALEVIEHLENPRHFFREISRVLRPGGFGFISTPNNHSLTSMLTFVTRGMHRAFQEASYPAHITPLLKIDFERLLKENGLHRTAYYYSGHDTMPVVHWGIHFGGALFSMNLGVLFQKP